MKNNNLNGFTLIELLAVIVILALIIVIAVPTVMKTIASAKKGAIESDAKLIINAIEKKKATDDAFIYTDITTANIEEKLGMKNANYKSIEITEADGKPSVVIEGQNKYDGYTAYGNYSSISVVPSDEYEEEEPAPSDYVNLEGVNKPRLATGMTAIKWNGSAWVDVVDPDIDTSWYDYTNKEWANAKTADGSMWVWIPRYAYQIATNFHTSTTGTINIKFLKNITNTASDGTTVQTTPTYSGSSQTNYIKHPTFAFGSTELTGFWVAKFEPSGSTDDIDIIPSVASFRDLNVLEQFATSRNMETNTKYGWDDSGAGIDTHMMKNIEWGAVAYLSQSLYGKNAEIWINPSGDFITGCAGTSANASMTSGCTYPYTSANGQQSSTTGNIYGIYDMVGGAWEYVAAYVDNGGATTISTADAKYRDAYVQGTPNSSLNNYAANSTMFGDAVWETSLQSSTSWYGEDAFMPYTYFSWFTRGGLNWLGADSGIFCFSNFDGWPKGDAPPEEPNPGVITFRPIILLDSSL